MNGVTFGSKHSYDDFGLWLTGVDIGSPTPKRTTQEVPGRDGAIDLTYALSSETHYKNRPLTFTFQKADSTYSWDELYRNVSNAIHGRRLHIVQDSDPNYYWDAFCTVEKPKFNGKIITMTVKLDAYPYKFKTAETTVTKTISGSGTIACSNIKKDVVPTITSSADVSITLNGSTVAVTSGTHKYPGLVLKEGTNTMSVTGSANITVKYREASL